MIFAQEVLGTTTTEFALLSLAPAVIFCPDLIMRRVDDDLAFIPPEYHDDPDATRASVRHLLALPFEVLCMDHGAPITTNPHAALRKLLDKAIARPE